MIKKSKNNKTTMISKMKSHGRLPVFILLTCILSLCFRYVIGLLSNGLLTDIIDTVNDRWYINAFFDYQNKNDATKSIEEISIIDIDDNFFSRGNLADVLKEVARCKPKVIGIDFAFNGIKNNDSLQSVKLRNTLDSLIDSLNIAVVAFKNDTVSQSYFTKELGIRYGLSNHRGFGRVELTDDTIPYFSTVLAELAGIEVKKMPSSFIVNYRNKSFNKCVIQNLLDYDKDTKEYYNPIDEAIDIIEDRIVLIGQTSNPYDMLDLPFIVNGKQQISGVEEIAYEVCSLLKHDKELEDYVTPYTQLKYLHLINFFLISCVCIIYYLCTKLKKEFCNSKYKALQVISIILKLVGLLFLILGIIILCFFITKYSYMMLDVLLFATAIVVLDAAWDLTQLFFHKSKEPKIRR